ncbi:acyltransferase family protein [Leifsonia poae]|uniref:acyltransferase family protein n=1 Tax=Leifsonia poae TaxID=110933 RepID=UPI003D66B5D1
MTLENAFNPKLNALNAVRLLLAVSVIVWHSLPLTGTPHPAPAITQLLGEGGVDGFFAISGFLIVSSWMRRPRWWPYLQARFLRILPAFWVCLIVTAVVIAPIGILLSRQAFPHTYVTDAATYVVKNAGLRITEFGIAGTPTNVPYPGVWNGSLWTLWWEFLCYLAVLAHSASHGSSNSGRRSPQSLPDASQV